MTRVWAFPKAILPMLHQALACGGERRHGDDPARQDTESGVLAEFLTRLEQHLHADANAEHRPARARELEDGVVEAARAHFVDAVLERAHARNGTAASP